MIYEEGEVILGLDLSMARTGYCIIRVHKGNIELMDYGTICTKKLNDQEEKLGYIYNRLRDLFVYYRPTKVVAESQFYGSNTLTLMALSYVRGLALLLCSQHGVKLESLAPSAIRKLIFGKMPTKNESGQKLKRADYKALIAEEMIKFFPSMNGAVDDITDAAAICLAFFKKNSH